LIVSGVRSEPLNLPAMKISLFNGNKEALPLNHRGLAYGDGLFETILVEQNGPQFLTAHLHRLNSGAKQIGLIWGPVDQEKLEQNLRNLTASISTPHVLKIMLLRSSTGRGYDFEPKQQTSDLIIELSPYNKPDWALRNASVAISTTYISENKTLAGLKHLNRLDSVLARQSARAQNAHESLMLDGSDKIIEGSMSNIFFFLNDDWLTPELLNAGVAGIIRQEILNKFSKIKIGKVFRKDLKEVKSAFICNSLIGLVPVSQLGDQKIDHHSDILKFKREIGILC